MSIPTPTQIRGHQEADSDEQLAALRTLVVAHLPALADPSTRSVSVQLGVLNRDFSVQGMRTLRTELKDAGWETSVIGLRDNIFVLRIAEFGELL